MRMTHYVLMEAAEFLQEKNKWGNQFFLDEFFKTLTSLPKLNIDLVCLAMAVLSLNLLKTSIRRERSNGRNS